MSRRREALRATLLLATLLAAHALGIRLMAHFRAMEIFLSAGATRSVLSLFGAAAFFVVRMTLLLCGPGLLLLAIFHWAQCLRKGAAGPLDGPESPRVS